MNPITEYMDKKKENKYIVIGVLVLFFAGLLYLSFLEKAEKKAEIDRTSSVTVKNKDTAFVDKKAGYYNSKGRKNNKIENNTGFYNLKQTVDNLEENLKKDTVYNENTAKDIDLIKQAILQQQAQATQNNHSTTNRTTTNRATTNRATTYKKEVVKEKSDPFKGMDDFFKNELKQSDNNNNNNNNTYKTNNKNQKTDHFIYAFIDGDNTVTSNSRVKLRLSKDAIIEGKKYRRNTPFFATATFGVYRMLLRIESINHTPVSLEAYDAEDSNLGIYINDESLSAEAFTDSKDDLIDEVDVSGIPVGQTLKNIFKKGNNAIKIHLLNNDKLILKTTNK